MDPLSALSVVGTIVQFVDFGTRVVSKGHQIYKAAHGSSPEFHDLEIVTNDLLVLQTKLGLDAARKSNKNPTEDHHGTERLRASCETIATELLQRLNMAKAQGRYRRWKSLRQAIKSVCSKSEVNEMAARMKTLRDELHFHVLVHLKQKIDIISVQQSDRYQTLDALSKEILKTFREDRDILSESLHSLKTTFMSRQNNSDSPAVKTGDRIITSIEQHIGVPYQTPRYSHEQEGQKHLVARADYKLVETAILKSLYFEDLDDRHESIVKAHGSTFSWIFEDPVRHNRPWDSFVAWLQNESGIFWINGKAASGKSTLMKFLFQHPGLGKSLSKWRSRDQLICARFFFWNLGSQLQKTQIGLLRSLLHQILSQRTSLIAAALPELWRQMIEKEDRELLLLHNGWYPWSLLKLKQLFRQILTTKATNVDFCFFIDGLDEFDGDHTVIMGFFKELSLFPNAKFCLSSRPLMVFDYELQGCPKLCLQDLTVGDIKAYIEDKFLRNSKVSKLAQEEPLLVSQLVNEIVVTSSGVFLWVALVVKSLLQGVTNDDRAIDLQRRLRTLPSELDDLYSQMLRSIQPPFYIEQASRLLQIVYQSLSRISALALSFADDDNTNLPFEMQLYRLTPSEVSERERKITSRLKSRCAGLLEVAGDAKNKSVHYLHLTVREFLEKPDIWSNLLKHTADYNFDASTSLLRAGVCLLQVPKSIDIQCIEIGDIMQYALQAENATGKAQIRLLDELDRANAAMDSNYSKGRHWSATLNHARDQPESFLTYAISQGLTLYVQAKLGQQTREINRRSQRPLLTYVTLYRPLYARGNMIQPSMVAMLLGAGLNPNRQFRINAEFLTPWQLFLKRMHQGRDASYSQADNFCLDTCKLYVLHGALVNALIESQGEENKYYSALDIINGVFSHLPHESVQELREMMLQRGARTISEINATTVIRKRPYNEEQNDSYKWSKERHKRRNFMQKTPTRADWQPRQIHWKRQHGFYEHDYIQNSSHNYHRGQYDTSRGRYRDIGREI